MKPVVRRQHLVATLLEVNLLLVLDTGHSAEQAERTVSVLCTQAHLATVRTSTVTLASMVNNTTVNILLPLAAISLLNGLHNCTLKSDRFYL